MQRLCLHAALLLTAVCVPSLGRAEIWQPKKLVTAVGIGDLSSGNKAKARDDAIANIKDAIQAYVEALIQDGLPVPPENHEVVTVDAA